MQVVVRDINAALIDEFDRLGCAGIIAECGDALSAPADAIVSPANSFGFMDGGIDLVYSRFFGWQLQDWVQEDIAKLPFGELLVGQAIVVPTTNTHIGHLIVAPTMRVPKLIYDPADVMLATRAAIRAALNAGFQKVVLPGMGTGCGRVPFAIAAKAMRDGIEQGRLPRPRPTSWRSAQQAHFGLAA